MDMERRVQLTPMEHVENLAAIGQQSQEQKGHPQKKKRRQANLSLAVEKEEQIRQMEQDGHIDYRA